MPSFRRLPASPINQRAAGYTPAPRPPGGDIAPPLHMALGDGGRPQARTQGGCQRMGGKGRGHSPPWAVWAV